MKSHPFALVLAIAVLAAFIPTRHASANPERDQAQVGKQTDELSLGYPLPLSRLRGPARIFRTPPSAPLQRTPELQEGQHTDESVVLMQTPRLQQTRTNHGAHAAAILDEITTLLEGRLTIVSPKMFGIFAKFANAQLSLGEVDGSLRHLRPGLEGHTFQSPDIAVTYDHRDSAQSFLSITANPTDEILFDEVAVIGMGLGFDENSPSRDYSISVSFLHPF